MKKRMKSARPSATTVYVRSERCEPFGVSAPLEIEVFCASPGEFSLIYCSNYSQQVLYESLTGSMMNCLASRNQTCATFYCARAVDTKLLRCCTAKEVSSSRYQVSSRGHFLFIVLILETCLIPDT